MKKIYRKYFMKQKLMQKLLISLIPITLGAVYFFGWRTLVLMGVVTAFGVLTEYIFEKRLNKPVSEAVLVSCVLFTLTLPVATPFWVAIIGIIFGIAFAKEVFGGFGYNVFNPALAARTFLYVCFPEYLTAKWNVAASGFPGGFARYVTPAIDTVSQSTPMLILRNTGAALPIEKLFLGNVSGSLGETSGLLIIIAAIYLIYTKTADWRLMASSIIGFTGLNTILYMTSPGGYPDPLFSLFSGGFLFAAVFFVTEPITAPKNNKAKWVYGILIGIIATAIRTFGIFIGGAMFAILIMNSFAPIMDAGFKYYEGYKKRKQVTV